MKKKIMLGTLTLFLLSCMAFLAPIKALAAEKVNYPEASGYVVDDANLLSDKTETFIKNINLQYEKQSEKPEIAVATVESLDGLDVDEYAVKLFEKWKIGNADKDNGVLILLAKDERKIKIEVGYGLEGTLTDSGTGQILDDHLDLLKDDNFNEGIYQIFYDVALEVNEEYGYDDKTIFKNEQVPERNKTDFSDYFSIGIVILIIFLFIIGNGGGRGRGGPGGRRRNSNLGYFILGNILGGGGGNNRSGGGGGFGGFGGGSSGGGGSSRGF